MWNVRAEARTLQRGKAGPVVACGMYGLKPVPSQRAKACSEAEEKCTGWCPYPLLGCRRRETGSKKMTWESFYLICFVVGLALSAISLLGGMGHIGGHIHLPHLPHATHLPTVAHVPHAPHLPHAGSTAQAGGGSGQGAATVPWWNAFSILVFLCWFGAAGYLLTRYGGFVAGVVLALAAI